MGQKIKKIGVKKEPGYLYFVDKDGDISHAKMARSNEEGGRPKKIAKAGVKKQAGFLYFIDKDGDVSRVKMVRGGKPESKKPPPDLFPRYLESFLERKRNLWLKEVMVFLSYSHKDSKKVKQINKYLKNKGINTWFDKDVLKGGQAWRKEIKKAIKECFLFVSFLSENSVNSRGYFQNEAKTSQDVFKELPENQPFIIPVKLDKNVTLPDSLYDVHCIDFYSLAQVKADLVDSIQHHYGQARSNM